MIVYTLRRVIYAFVLLFFAATAIFFIVYSVPGSPYDRIIREIIENSPPNKLLSMSNFERLDNLLGLNQSVPIRYFYWIRNIFTGNFGESWSVVLGQPVFSVILKRIPYTLILMFSAILLSLAVAVPAGLYSALRPYTDGDLILTAMSFFGMAMPSFWLGLLLISIFSNTLGWLPYTGVVSNDMPGDIITLIGRVLSLGLANRQIAGQEGVILIDGLKHLILPTVTLSVVLATRWSRFIRMSFLEVLHQDYIRAARAKGASERAIIFKHALRNGFIPVITIMALDIPMLFTGSFVTEIVFGWPGIGRLYMNSISLVDWPLLHGLLIVNAFLIILANLIADILYGIIDPRVKAIYLPAARPK